MNLKIFDCCVAKIYAGMWKCMAVQTSTISNVGILLLVYDDRVWIYAFSVSQCKIISYCHYLYEIFSMQMLSHYPS